MKQPEFPEGWDEERVRRVIAYYGAQTEEEVVAEGEATLDPLRATVMEVPVDLVLKVRELIAKQ